jgi:sigma-E factor negative regulatory protein RseC
MIEEQAVVIEIKGDQAMLEIERSQPCGLCGATRGCGISMWGRIFGQHRGMFSAVNSLQVKTGDRVIVGVEETALLSSSLIAYILPLLLLCAGAWLIPQIFNVDVGSRLSSDIYAVLGAMVGLIGGLLIVRFLTNGKRLIGRYQPVMLRRSEMVFIQQCSR